MPDAKYGEPWEVANEMSIRDRDGAWLCDVVFDDPARDRVIACVNAMSGIDDPTHAAEVLRLVGEWAEARQALTECNGKLLRVLLGTDSEDFPDQAKLQFKSAEQNLHRVEQALLAAARKMKEQP